jgi:VanZ family protein
VEIKKGFADYQLPLFAWALAIFVASSIPAADFPDSPLFSHDKVLHFIAFFGFALLLERALHHQDRLPSLSRRSHLATLLITILYGAFDETHQAFVPGRTPDKYDLLADTIGAVAAILVVWFVARRRRSAATQ